MNLDMRPAASKASTPAIARALLGRYAWRLWAVPVLVTFASLLSGLYLVINEPSLRSAQTGRISTGFPADVYAILVFAWVVLWWQSAAPFALSLGFARRRTFLTAAVLSFIIPGLWSALFTAWAVAEATLTPYGRVALSPTAEGPMRFSLGVSDYLFSLGPLGLACLGVAGTIWAGWGVTRGILSVAVALIVNLALAAIALSIAALFLAVGQDYPSMVVDLMAPMAIAIFVITPLILWVHYRLFRRMPI